jgi:hypothetical protein
MSDNDDINMDAWGLLKQARVQLATFQSENGWNVDCDALLECIDKAFSEWDGASCPNCGCDACESGREETENDDA